MKLFHSSRVDVEKSKSTCSRMCMKEFAKTGEKGYPLQKIYDVIGAEKVKFQFLLKFILAGL